MSSTTAQQNLTLAQLNLQAAQAEVDKEKRTKAKHDLTEARAEGRRLEGELKAKVTAFRKAEAESANLQSELEETSSTLRNLALPGEFPTDDELQQHEEVKAYLTAERDALLTKFRDAVARREQLRRDAIVLDSQLAQLRYRIRNLEAVARGEKLGGGWEGGVTAVA